MFQPWLRLLSNKPLIRATLVLSRPQQLESWLFTFRIKSKTCVLKSLFLKVIQTRRYEALPVFLLQNRLLSINKFFDSLLCREQLWKWYLHVRRCVPNGLWLSSMGGLAILLNVTRKWDFIGRSGLWYPAVGVQLLDIVEISNVWNCDYRSLGSMSEMSRSTWNYWRHG